MHKRTNITKVQVDMLFEANMNVIIIIMLSIFCLIATQYAFIIIQSLNYCLPSVLWRRKKNNTNIYEHVHECIKHKVNKILYFKWIVINCTLKRAIVEFIGNFFYCISFSSFYYNAINCLNYYFLFFSLILLEILLICCQRHQLISTTEDERSEKGITERLIEQIKQFN